MWHVPDGWIEVDRERFERVINQRDYRRSGWCGFAVYRDVPTEREFAAIEDGGAVEKYWIHPDLADV